MINECKSNDTFSLVVLNMAYSMLEKHCIILKVLCYISKKYLNDKKLKQGHNSNGNNLRHSENSILILLETC